MQIVPFLTHYQLVYANFDFSSFSLISYTVKCVTLLPYKIQFIHPQNLEVYLSNLVSLGILSEKYGQYKDDENTYNSIVQKSDYDKLETEYVPNEFLTIEIEKGFYEVTEFGRLFIKACLGKK